MFMQEHRSSEEKNAVATLVPTQLAIRSSFSHDMNPPQLFSIAMISFDYISKFSFLGGWGFGEETEREREKQWRG